MAKLLNALCEIVLVVVCLQAIANEDFVNGQAGSIGFHLNGTYYPNGSTVLRRDIGVGDAALQCTTNNATCCSNNFPETRSGEFYFPDGSTVPILNRASEGYYRDRRSQKIRLHRQHSGVYLGRFRCEIPDANGKIVNLFIHIVDELPDISLHITSSGTNVVGTTYSLECLVVSTSHHLIYRVSWFDSRNVEVASGMVNTTEQTTASTLRFDPLMSTHAGTYACAVTLEYISLSKSVNVIAENPVISAVVDNGQVESILGEPYSLNCTIMGAEKLVDAVVAYCWVKDGNATLNQTTNIISFTFLTVFDAGQYVCQATITSSFINEPITIFSTKPLDIIPTLPDPTSVFVQSDPPCPVKTESEVTLTCTVTLSDILANVPSHEVTLVWTGPLGTLSGGDVLTTGNHSLIYTSALLISSATSNENYTCQARVVSRLSSFKNSQMKANSIMIATVNIVISIDVLSGSNTAGETYSLTCSTVILGSYDQPSISWLESNSGDHEILTTKDETRVISDTVVKSDNNFSRSLSFSPLAYSDAGLFTCRVTVHGITEIRQIAVVVKNPNITIHLSDHGDHPNAGHGYHLHCIVTLTSAENFNLTYRWKKDGILLSQTGATLSLPTLRLSDAGQYICETTISSVYLAESIVTTSNTLNVSLQIPSPKVSVVGKQYLPPFNGTIYNLTGTIHLDTNIVNTNITAFWVWSRDGIVLERQNTSSCQISIAFQPLTTFSSGLYHLKVVVRSSNYLSSLYIAENSGHTNYNLTVLPLPSVMPSISVDLQHPSSEDRCSQALIATCTTNPVANLFVLPTITWIGPDGEEIHAGRSSNPVIIDQEKTQLLFNSNSLDNRGMYRCRASVLIPEAFIENQFDEATAMASSILPGSVQNLHCEDSSSANSLHVIWEQPLLHGSQVVSYRVDIRELKQTNEIVEFNVQNFNLNDLDVFVHGLAAKVPYSISVTSLSLTGCGDKQHIYCFTYEGEPPLPVNVRVIQYNSTTIGVSWTKYTLVELTGLASYVVTYNLISSKKRDFGRVIAVPWNDSSTVITNLQPGAQYIISVRTSTSTGNSAQIEAYIKLVDKTERHQWHSYDPVFIITVVCGVVTAVTVIVIAATTIAALKLVLGSRRTPRSTNLKENRFHQSSLIMANNTEISPGMSNRSQETSNNVQPNASYQAVPLPPLQVVIEQQPEEITAYGSGYTQCPLYDTRYSSIGNQLLEETSFNQTHISPDSGGHVNNEQ